MTAWVVPFLFGMSIGGILTISLLKWYMHEARYHLKESIKHYQDALDIKEFAIKLNEESIALRNDLIKKNYSNNLQNNI